MKNQQELQEQEVSNLDQRLMSSDEIPQFGKPNFKMMMQRPMEVKKVILNQNDVSLSLTKHVISAVSKDKNLILSPLSIQVVLAVLAAGSSGPTQHQLLSFLKATSMEQLNSCFSEMVRYALADGHPFGGPRLSWSNGVWVDHRLPLKPSFREIVRNNYKSAIRNVDFRNKNEECREEVNAWSERKTKGLMLIFENTIYFKGAWPEKFDSSLTKDDDFFLLNGSPIRAPFMRSYKSQFLRAFNSFKVLRLPYKRDRAKDPREFSMLIFLPRAKDGLPSLIEKASSQSGFIERHLPYKQVEVGSFRIPKFKMGFDFKACEVLKGEGVELPFKPGGITEIAESDIESEYLEVSSIYHKALIEVEEEGTKACAVTCARYRPGCCRMKVEVKKFNFVADHPFMFVIREDTTGVVLFVGQLLNPLAA